jgi:hypothetical protein
MVTTVVLLLYALGAGAPAGAAGAERHSAMIWDPAAQPSWILEFAGPGSSYDVAEDVAITADGITYVAGTLGGNAGGVDASLMKVVGGAPAWPLPRTYNSPYNDVDAASFVAVGPGNTIYTAGYSVGSNGKSDLLVVRWSTTGTVKWAKRYDGPAHNDEWPTGMGVDAAGNVTVCGLAADATSTDWVVVSWSKSGVRRWTSFVDAAEGGTLAPRGMTVAPDSSVYVTGMSNSPAGLFMRTIRYASSGAQVWSKTYSGPAAAGAYGTAVVNAPQGGVYVCGTTWNAATCYDGLVVHYSRRNGTRDVFTPDAGAGDPTDQVFLALAVTSTGQVVAAGTAAPGGPADCHLAVYTVDGTIFLQNSWGYDWYDEFVDVGTDAFGGYYATGTIHTAVDATSAITMRGSVLTGGGGFSSLWSPGFVSAGTEARALAVSGTSLAVVGRCDEGGASGGDQVLLNYTY